MADRQPLRVAVIGLGWAGQQHMAAYAEAADADMVAIAGMEPAQLTRLGDLYGVPRDHRFGDWRELLDRTKLDIVSIAAPTTLHEPIAVAALNAGIHVLSEKPIAQNAPIARRMVEAAELNDRVLDVVFNHRRRGDVQALKKIIDAGLMGDIYYAKAGWLRREGIPGLGSWFTRRAVAGGGPLMDIGVHMLDMTLHLLGEPGVRAATAATYAEFGPRGRGSSAEATMRKSGVEEGEFDVEDLSTAFLRLDGGGTLLLESSWAQWIPKDRCYVTVYGSDGGASVEWGAPSDPHRSLNIWTEKEGIPASLQPAIPPDGKHKACVLDFLEKVRAGDYANHRGYQALSRAVIVDACYASAEAGHEVSLN
ncbi:MAG TPA: Gfo/Idh/MocA family oxidoreductase [Propionibacteriaceae bacterium]|nr:Gfo/Idh/MocA family oxidoreductase [Propionibacteriaceae bacterium]